MAERRMISKSVVLSHKFLSLSKEAQLLYFMLMLETDDEGFVGNFGRFIKSVDGEIVNILELRDAGFVILFDTNSLVIVHFMKQNKIKKDRFKQTDFVSERELLEVANDCYRLK
jgi:hypothetical protein